LTVSNARYTEAYNLHVPQMICVARLSVDADAEDVVHETFMEVMALPTVPEGDIGGLLMQRLKWRLTDFHRQKRETLESDLRIPRIQGGTDSEDRELSGPLTLADLEAANFERDTPAWPSAIDYDTPEAIVSADQLRNRIRDIATEAHGAEAYAMFCAVMIDGETQARVAKEFRVDQTTVSRTVARVREAVRSSLIAEGYDV
jgi:RNA polymerase sigma factor (sigma-70 family)